MIQFCDPEPQWYAVQSKPRQEVRAEGDLAAWGVEVFLPRVRCARRRHVGGSDAAEPLFPGYLFARFAASQMLHKVRYTRGVSRVLGTAEGPTRVPGEIVDVIRGHIGADGLVQTTTTYAAGELLRITDGPLRDFIGVFQATTGAPERVRLLLSAVGGALRVVARPEQVERVRC